MAKNRTKVFKLMRISSGHRIRPSKRQFIMAKSVTEPSPFILLQVIQVLLLVSRIGFCVYKILFRLELQREAFDDEVHTVGKSIVTKESDLFVWIQMLVLLSYIITAFVFVYFIVQETHLEIPMAILCVDLWLQFGSSILVCLWIIVEMIGVGTVYYLIERKKLIRKMQL